MRVFQIGFLLILAFAFTSGCLQSGLVSNESGVETNESSSSSSLFDPPEGTVSATIKTVLPGTEYYKTSYGDKSVNPFTVGYGITGAGECGAEPGHNFCVSNEQLPPQAGTSKSVFDSLCPCKKPFTDAGTSRENSVVSYLQTLDSSREDATGYPFIIQAVQLWMTQSVFSAAYPVFADKTYARLDMSDIVVWTAPLKPALTALSAPSGTNLAELQWDPAQETAFVYKTTASNPNTPNCDPGSNNAVGFHLTAGQKNIFLTGLWVFERTEWRPYETRTPEPYSGPQLTGVFATRASVYGSLVLPDMEDEQPQHQFLPSKVSGGSGGDGSPGPIPNPALFHFGFYRGNSIPLDDANTIPVPNYPQAETPLVLSNNGAYVTPMMGKYVLGAAHNSPVSNWNQRVVTGICVKGRRLLYAGGELNTAGTLVPKLIFTQPAIHGMKAELRKIQVKVQ